MYDMKRTLIGSVVLMVCIGTVTSQDLGSRTLINGENAPLVYLSLTGTQADLIASRESAIELLRTNRRRLETVAPGGMWRIGDGPQTILGYYSGGASVLGYQLLIRAIGGGTNPVTVNRQDLIRGAAGETVGLAPWELPDRSEPVLVDGDPVEWQEIEPLLQFSRFFTPSRIEDAAAGTEITMDDASLWRRSGTAIRTVKSIAGARSWYLAIEASEEIGDGTAYLFRIYGDRDDPAPLGELVVLIDGGSGPVVLRDVAGATRLVGEYARTDRTLEVEVRRPDIELTIENVFDSSASFDVATTRRVDTRAERFSIGTAYFRDVVR